MDKRLAIIKGINDYDKEPLDYCVADANAMADVLIKRCRFKPEDIYRITSDAIESIKDITGHFDSTLAQIAGDLKPDEDSVFFYFAGHGEYHFSESGLWFQDSIMEISTVFNKINALQPKYQCYVIDACECGGKVLTRGKSDKDLIENLINKSSGILFMYGATENERAKEYSKFGHGLFTYHFLEAIKTDENYDKDGILTPNRIQDIISKETSTSSGFKQTPVIENRTIGYYPFAFIESAVVKEAESRVESNERCVPHEKITEVNQERAIDKEYFPFVPGDVRRSLFAELRPKINEIFNAWTTQLSLDGYNKKIDQGISLFGMNREEKIVSELMYSVEREKVPPVSGLFHTETVEATPFPFASRSVIDSLMGKNKKHHVRKWIHWNSEDIIPVSLYCTSDNIELPNVGLTIVVYHALYGVGLGSVSFYMDFNGWGNAELQGPYISLDAFKVHTNTSENILKYIEKHTKNFEKDVQKWIERRRKAISDFNDKAI